MGGYTFLQWPLRLLFDYASIFGIGKNVSSERLCNARILTTSRFLAAAISAWFSLELLNRKAIAKVGRENSKQYVQDQQQQDADDTGLTLRNDRMLDSEVSQGRPPVRAGETLDLTLLAVAPALDSVVVYLYRRFNPSFPKTALVSSTMTAISRYADSFIFSLSSGTVVCLHFGTIAS